jgi:hypothetical protein
MSKYKNLYGLSLIKSSNIYIYIYIIQSIYKSVEHNEVLIVAIWIFMFIENRKTIMFSLLKLLLIFSVKIV